MRPYLLQILENKNMCEKEIIIDNINFLLSYRNDSSPSGFGVDPRKNLTKQLIDWEPRLLDNNRLKDINSLIKIKYINNSEEK